MLTTQYRLHLFATISCQGSCDAHDGNDPDHGEYDEQYHAMVMVVFRVVMTSMTTMVAMMTNLQTTVALAIVICMHSCIQ